MSLFEVTLEKTRREVNAVIEHGTFVVEAPDIDTARRLASQAAAIEEDDCEAVVSWQETRRAVSNGGVQSIAVDSVLPLDIVTAADLETDDATG